ncbi:MAG: thioredoxin, partial [Planctomycetes bacterium]|nr:thioredoxin [Planctomycetota bacterium]
MRLICPHCMSGVSVPDDAAGKDAPCPSCGRSFPTPARYAPEVAPAPAPAPVPPPIPV